MMESPTCAGNTSDLLHQLVKSPQGDERTSHEEERPRLAVHEGSGDHRGATDDY
jgi:hypothetical protein